MHWWENKNGYHMEVEFFKTSKMKFLTLTCILQASYSDMNEKG